MKLSDQYSHSAIVLSVRNLVETIKFYEDKLDFEVHFRWGDPTEYVVGKLGNNTSIHFTQDPKAGIIHSSIYVFAYDVNKVYDEMLSRKVKISNKIDDRDYGMRDFDIDDNNGFRLTFGTGFERLKKRE